MNKIIATKKAPAAVGPYSQAIQSGNMIFTSGQIGLVPETGILREGVSDQARQALENLTEVLKEAGVGIENVVKVVVFLKDMSDFATVNAIYQEFFTDNYPARSCVAVAGLPKDALVEVEAVACL